MKTTTKVYSIRWKMNLVDGGCVEYIYPNISLDGAEESTIQYPIPSCFARLRAGKTTSCRRYAKLFIGHQGAGVTSVYNRPRP
jgi:hypothetical protein